MNIFRLFFLGILIIIFIKFVGFGIFKNIKKSDWDLIKNVFKIGKVEKVKKQEKKPVVWLGLDDFDRDIEEMKAQIKKEEEIKREERKIKRHAYQNQQKQQCRYGYTWLCDPAFNYYKYEYQQQQQVKYRVASQQQRQEDAFVRKIKSGEIWLEIYR